MLLNKDTKFLKFVVFVLLLKLICVLAKFGVEADNFLKLGVYFSNQPLGWWWLARQLLLQAVDCASTFRDDGGRIEAICRHILGRFYLNQCTFTQIHLNNCKC